MGLITLSQITNGSALDATVPNNNFTTLANEFNGNIDNANVKATANISGTKLLDNSIGVNKLTAGVINQFHVSPSTYSLTTSQADVTGATGTITVPASARSVQLLSTVVVQTDQNDTLLRVDVLKAGVSMRSRFFKVPNSGVAYTFSFFTQDDTPAAGSYIYKWQASYSGTAATATIASTSDFMGNLV